MAEKEVELSAADLKAFDALIAHLDESGQTTISSREMLFATPAVTFLLREAVKWAVRWAARTAICIRPPDEIPEDMEHLPMLKDQISLDELVELRRTLG